MQPMRSRKSRMLSAGRVDPGQLDSLRACVDDFDFDGARAKLSQIASECHLSAG